MSPAIVAAGLEIASVPVDRTSCVFRNLLSKEPEDQLFSDFVLHGNSLLGGRDFQAALDCGAGGDFVAPSFQVGHVVQVDIEEAQNRDPGEGCYVGD